MNSNVSVSTTRKIGETFIHVTVAASSYSPDGVTVKATEAAAAIEQFVAGLPGENVSDLFGGPANQSPSSPPPDVAPLVDADVVPV